MSHPHPSRGIPLGTRQPLRGALRVWRRQQLINAGVDELTARRLAGDDTIDLHEFVSRTERTTSASASNASATKVSATKAEELPAGGGPDA